MGKPPTDLLFYENQLLNQGLTKLAGLDENGVGTLAGPIVSTAIVFDFSKPVNVVAPLQLKTKIKQVKVNDSKKLSPSEREALYPEILKNCLSVGIAWVYPEEINQIHNILQASSLARARAAALVQADHFLVDHFTLEGLPCTGITKGDAKSALIAMASIVGKVTRDRYMCELAKEFPQYGFEENKGYFSEEHVRAIEKYGPTPHHRLYYGPVQEATKVFNTHESSFKV